MARPRLQQGWRTSEVVKQEEKNPVTHEKRRHSYRWATRQNCFGLDSNMGPGSATSPFVCKRWKGGIIKWESWLTFSRYQCFVLLWRFREVAVRLAKKYDRKWSKIAGTTSAQTAKDVAKIRSRRKRFAATNRIFHRVNSRQRRRKGRCFKLHRSMAYKVSASALRFSASLAVIVIPDFQPGRGTQTVAQDPQAQRKTLKVVPLKNPVVGFISFVLSSLCCSSRATWPSPHNRYLPQYSTNIWGALHVRKMH